MIPHRVNTGEEILLKIKGVPKNVLYILNIYLKSIKEVFPLLLKILLFFNFYLLLMKHLLTFYNIAEIIRYILDTFLVHSINFCTLPDYIL